MDSERYLPLFAAIVIVGTAVTLLVQASAEPTYPPKPFPSYSPIPPLGSVETSIDNLMIRGRPVAKVLKCDEFTLSLGCRRNDHYEVELIRVDPDGTTFIRAMQTNQILLAKPGESYSSAEFGSSGLQLCSADPATQFAEFRRVWCEDIYPGMTLTPVGRRN